MLRCSSFFGCLLLSSPSHSDLNSSCFHVAVFYLRLSSSVIESSLLDPSSIIVFVAFLSFLCVSSAVTCFSFRIVFIFFVQLSFIFDCSCRCIFVLLLKKAFNLFAAVFVFLRVSSVVLAFSLWFEFILFHVAVFYLPLSSVVESSLSDPSIIYCFCCISHLSSGVFCCHFLLVSYCIQFVPCSCRLSSIASCHCIFVFLLKKAFIVFAAVFVFLRLSSVVLALSYWFEFILFYVAVFYLRLPSSVVESSLSDPSIIYCFCCISHLSSGVYCCHFLLVSNCIHSLLCSCRLSSIASCRSIFVLLLKKSIYCICCGVHLSSGVFCCPRVVILI